MKARETYIGKSLLGDVTIRAEVVGYAPLVTLTITNDGSSFSLYTSEFGAEELAKMLAAAAETIRRERYATQS